MVVKTSWSKQFLKKKMQNLHKILISKIGQKWTANAVSSFASQRDLYKYAKSVFVGRIVFLKNYYFRDSAYYYYFFFF